MISNTLKRQCRIALALLALSSATASAATPPPPLHGIHGESPVPVVEAPASAVMVYAQGGALVQHEVKLPLGTSIVRFPCLPPGLSMLNVDVSTSGDWRPHIGFKEGGGPLPFQADTACARPDQRSLRLRVNARWAGMPLSLSYFRAEALWQQTRRIHLDTRSGAVWLETQDQLRQNTGADWDDVHITLSVEESLPKPLQQNIRAPLPQVQTRSLSAPAPASASVSESRAALLKAMLESGALKMPPLHPGGLPLGPRTSTVAPLRQLRSDDQAQMLPPLRSEPVPVYLISRVQLGGEPRAHLVASSPALAQLLRTRTGLLQAGPTLLMRDGELVGPYRITAQDIEAGQLSFGIDPRLLVTVEPMSRRYGGDEVHKTAAVQESITLRAGEASVDLELLAATPQSETSELRIACTSSLPPTEEPWRGMAGLSAWRVSVSTAPWRFQRECVSTAPAGRELRSGGPR